YKYTFLYKLVPETEPETEPGSARNPPAAETVPFTGRVLSKGDRVPLAGVHVLLDSGELDATTDTDGRFHFDAVPLGRHVVTLRGPNVTPTENPVTLTRGIQLEVTYFAASRVRYSATVRGQRAVTETVEHTLSLEELKHIPGTQGDTLKAVQN